MEPDYKLRITNYEFKIVLCHPEGRRISQTRLGAGFHLVSFLKKTEKVVAVLKVLAELVLLTKNT